MGSYIAVALCHGLVSALLTFRPKQDACMGLYIPGSNPWQTFWPSESMGIDCLKCSIHDDPPCVIMGYIP